MSAPIGHGTKDDPYICEFIKPRPVIWNWWVFGSDQLQFHLTHDVSWLARKTCEVMLKSKWVKA